MIYVPADISDVLRYYQAISDYRQLPYFDSMLDYPWIKSANHLKKINRYRKRVGQKPIKFNNNDLADLILLGGDL